jgi:hypothetical protein
MEIGRQQLGPTSDGAPPPAAEETSAPEAPPPPPPPERDECQTDKDCKDGMVCAKPMYAGEHRRKCVAP